jgi:hypothetical protein
VIYFICSKGKSTYNGMFLKTRYIFKRKCRGLEDVYIHVRLLQEIYTHEVYNFLLTYITVDTFLR